MEIKEFVDTNLTVAIQARLQRPREGLHLSDLELCLKKSYYRKLFPQPISDKQGVMYAIGFGVQQYLYPEPEKLYICDGINCSPDYYEGYEIKTTRAAIKNFNPCKPHWLLRIKGYCKVLNRLDYVLSVVFLIPAEIRSWQFVFTQQEIEDNWSDVLFRSAILKDAFRDNQPPTPDFHEPWECKFCECAGFCLPG